MRWTAWWLATALAVLCVAVVLAECPNGCSGNGDCMNKDMCNCYKNFQGNDCADRTCLFGRAHVDTPKGDIDMDQDRYSPGWLLARSQQDPAQTYEYFNPDALADEAHFYMECSNKGICDRATGLCTCFDGYEGNGCQRTTCPGKCNGHGTCESMRELGLKNAGTLFGREGDVGAVTYDLWDSNSTYGCRCDPWFFGPDCSKRNCKVGVDPMYKSAGAPRYETFVVHVYRTTGTTAFAAGDFIRLRLFDHFGESFITKQISVVGTAATVADAVEAAIMGVPNLTFRKVTCEAMGAGTDLAKFASVQPGTLGTSVTCQYTENPGKMRIPEVAATGGTVTAAVVVTSTMQGENADWFTVKSGHVVSSIDGTGLIVTLASASPSSASLNGQLLKIGPHIVLATATGNTGATLNLQYALMHTIESNSPIYVVDPALSNAVTLAATKAVDDDVPVGSSTLIFKSSIGNTLAKGDLIFFENAFYYVQGFSDNTAAATGAAQRWYALLDKPFGGRAADGLGLVGTDLTNPTKVTRDMTKLVPYPYVAECSGRGICGYDTGICTCFKGYTNDNCDTQNILAL